LKPPAILNALAVQPSSPNRRVRLSREAA
jgi:hypothetical protein